MIKGDVPNRSEMLKYHP